MDGILLVDKPTGFTSHDVVALVRRRLRIDKVGHGGTLDPGATGLLVLLLGKATKLSDRVMAGDKTYCGTLRLGSETTTQDAEGEVTATSDPAAVTEAQLREAFASLTGDIYQMPPMVSALKKDGVALYKLARKGQEVEREARLVHVFRFDLLAFGIPDCTIEVKCGKGTYVRTLCHDVGRKIGCLGHLAGLRRTRSGNFSIDNAITVEQIKKMETSAELRPFLLPMASVL
ncbi:MAG: tRNA pseudouridine(55) synthase TruB [Kiritimatiellaeota bacterium]|nr:tRNA pseudouridine(55) synthase TruB [Kiritimatiellota bacterium]